MAIAESEIPQQSYYYYDYNKKLIQLECLPAVIGEGTGSFIFFSIRCMMTVIACNY